MGNSQSTEEHPHGHQHHHHPHHHGRSSPAAGRPSPREGGPSKQPLSALSHERTTPTPPKALVSSPTAATSTSPINVSRSPASSTHTRKRSTTTSSIKPIAPLPDSTSVPAPGPSSMGQVESRHQPPSRASTAPVDATPSAVESELSPGTKPLDVPADVQQNTQESQDDPMPIAQSPYNLPQSNYTRPPRLPLPIEEEVHTPGSPIITPQDLSSPLDINGVDGAIPRRTSVLSATTVDDDDIGEDPAFALESDPLAPTIPTTVEWTGPGDKVFVTGTFVNWERKFKMHKNEGRDGVHATLQLKPGTHHIKFLVDGNMVTADHLPTTVDWTNILVNYIEVVAPLPESTETPAPAPAVPMPIPGAAITAGQAEGTAEAASRPLDIRTTGTTSEMESDLQSTLQPSATTDADQPTTTDTSKDSGQQVTEREPPGPPPKQKLPRPKYTNQLPDFLHDLDKYNDPADERCQRAIGASMLLPQPPSLPMFMSKSILNGTTPHKDDASVLIMPNHTVLNHLATSSIKSGVLATSGTTRYKRKVSL
nr:snf1 protein kinase subunit beta-3 [Quercus suber]